MKIALCIASIFVLVVGCWPLYCALAAVPGASASDRKAAGLADFYTGIALIDSHFSATDFKPDGNLSKKIWRRAAWTMFDRDASGKVAYPDAQTRVASFWTRDSIYFAFSSKFNALNLFDDGDSSHERWKLWDRDVVEVFLNPEPQRIHYYYEFEVAPNNRWIDLEIDEDKTPFNDASWNSGFEHAARIDTKHHIWTCEMRISFAALGVFAPGINQTWRLNLFRADGKSGPERRFLSWSSIPGGATFTFLPVLV